MSAISATGDRARLMAVAITCLLLAAGAVALLVHLRLNPSGTPIFGVSADTLPEAMALSIAILSGLLALQTFLALRRAPAAAGRPAADDRNGGAAPRFAGLFALCIAFILALPWAGFLLSGAVLVAAAAWLLGNRRHVTIVLVAILAPLLLDQFFEHAMVIYLPAGRWLP
ncbi:tripartite tricarboxylate transporter TctB family protein [Marinibaculum pumilum]|uniref:Tripartite tricarboxylate transporter TctB family protein n=1 Tax=Marinibaculum pumilum TaxID=1766165 RepID=A0ABV7KZS9_9PROT